MKELWVKTSVCNREVNSREFTFHFVNSLHESRNEFFRRDFVNFREFFFWRNSCSIWLRNVRKWMATRDTEGNWVNSGRWLRKCSIWRGWRRFGGKALTLNGLKETKKCKTLLKIIAWTCRTWWCPGHSFDKIYVKLM